MVSMDTPWYYNQIKVGTSGRGDPIVVNVGDLYVAGMPKDDFINYMISGNTAEQTQLEVLRKNAGERCTKLGISTAMATQLLLNHGTIAYADGCREEWAVYAHKKANTNRYGCLAIAVIATWVIYYIFS